jgi:hypothetical protein
MTAEVVAKMSGGNCHTDFSGRARTTMSRARAACFTVAAVAPISAARVAREAGPREFAIDTPVSELGKATLKSTADVARTDADVHVHLPQGLLNTI